MDNELEEIKREFLEMTDDEIIEEAEKIKNERKAQRKAHRRYEIARCLYLGYVACSAVAALTLFIVGYAIHNLDIQMWGALVLIVSIFSNLGLWSFVS